MEWAALIPPPLHSQEIKAKASTADVHLLVADCGLAYLQPQMLPVSLRERTSEVCDFPIPVVSCVSIFHSRIIPDHPVFSDTWFFLSTNAAYLFWLQPQTDRKFNSALGGFRNAANTNSEGWVKEKPSFFLDSLSNGFPDF